MLSRTLSRRRAMRMCICDDVFRIPETDQYRIKRPWVSNNVYQKDICRNSSWRALSIVTTGTVFVSRMVGVTFHRITGHELCDFRVPCHPLLPTMLECLCFFDVTAPPLVFYSSDVSLWKNKENVCVGGRLSAMLRAVGVFCCRCSHR